MSEAKRHFADAVADRRRRVGEIITKHLAEMKAEILKLDPDTLNIAWRRRCESRALPGYPENALAMGLQGKLGTVEPGMIADLVTLDADPSKNIAVLGDPEHVRTVIKDGKPIDLGCAAVLNFAGSEYRHDPMI